MAPPAFNGNDPVISARVVAGYSRGIGAPEDGSPIARNFSRFVQHETVAAGDRPDGPEPFADTG